MNFLKDIDPKVKTAITLVTLAGIYFEGRHIYNKWKAKEDAKKYKDKTVPSANPALQTVNLNDIAQGIGEDFNKQYSSWDPRRLSPTNATRAFMRIMGVRKQDIPALSKLYAKKFSSVLPEDLQSNLSSAMWTKVKPLFY